MTPDLLGPALVLAPLVLGIACWVVPVRLRPATSLVGHGLLLVGAATLAFVVTTAGVQTHDLGGWAPPLGIAVRADGLGTVFVLLAAVVVFAVACHAAAVGGQSPSVWALMALLQAGLGAVFLTGDLFNAYVGLEIVGIAAVGLVALGGRAAVRAALRYLIVAVLGSLFFLVAVGIIYGTTGTLDMALAGQRWAASGAPAALPLSLAAVGLALKCALFPLHGWLPDAHAAAPSAASPLLSALVVKAPFVVLLRLWFEVTGPDLATGVVLGVLGAAAVGWGGLQALVQTHLKRVVAYSTVAQVGYLFLAFPLALPGGDARLARAGVAAVVTLAVAHGLAKAAMFLAASTVKAKRGTDEVTTLPGLARHWPPMALAMALATVSLVGLPISVGFLGKWQLLSAAGADSAWWLIAVVLLGSLLSAFYLLRPVAGALRTDEPDADPWPPMPWRQVASPLGLAVAAGVLGVSSTWLVELAMVGWGVV